MNQTQQKKNTIAGYLKTRQQFQTSIQDILLQINEIYSPFLGAGLQYLAIPHHQVLQIVRAWSPPALLAWEEAVRKARSWARGAFIGIQVAEQINLVALIRVSKGKMHTTLMYVERNQGEVQLAGQALVLVDAALDAMAVYFNSTYIVVDSPLPEVVKLYEALGYQAARRTGRYPVSHLVRHPASAYTREEQGATL